MCPKLLLSKVIGLPSTVISANGGHKLTNWATDARLNLRKSRLLQLYVSHATSLENLILQPVTCLGQESRNGQSIARCPPLRSQTHLALPLLLLFTSIIRSTRLRYFWCRFSFSLAPTSRLRSHSSVRRILGALLIVARPED